MLLGLNLKGLLGVRGENQRAANDQGGADVDFGNLLEIFQGVVIHHLHGGEISTVVQDDKAKLLAAPAVSHPAADVHFGAGIFFGVFEQVTDGNQIHMGVPSLAESIRKKSPKAIADFFEVALSIRQLGRFYKRKINFL